MKENSDHRVVGLEALRFLCAFSVLVSHYPMFDVVQDHFASYKPIFAPFYALLEPFWLRGGFAVQYFWCISGFIFFWKYQNSLHQNTSGRTFFINRFSRLYPLHLLTLIIVAILQYAYLHVTGAYLGYLYNTRGNFLWHLLMLGNLNFPHDPSFNAVTWSVTLEIFAYISFFLLCRYVRYSTSVSIVIALASSVVFVAWGKHPNIAGCFAMFYFGGCAYFLHKVLAKHRLMVPVAIVLFGYIVALNELRDTWPTNGFFRMLICVPPAILAFSCFPIARILPAKLIQGLGNLTYSVYLIHFPLILLTMTICAKLGVHLDYRSRLLFIVFLGTVFIVGAVCYRYFEMPAQRYLRRRFLRSKPVEHASALRMM